MMPTRLVLETSCMSLEHVCMCVRASACVSDAQICAVCGSGRCLSCRQSLVTESRPFFWDGIVTWGSTCLPLMYSAIPSIRAQRGWRVGRRHSTALLSFPVPRTKSPPIFPLLLKSTQTQVFGCSAGKWAQALTHCHYSQRVFRVFGSQDILVRSISELSPLQPWKSRCRTVQSVVEDHTDRMETEKHTTLAPKSRMVVL